MPGRSDWRNVSRESPCRVCGKPDYCRIAGDGRVGACRRQEQGAYRTKVDKNGAPVYLHRLDGAAPPGALPARTRGPAPRRAAADALHAAYSALLACLHLSGSHWNALRARGLSDEVIARNEYRTFPVQGRARIAREMWDRFAEPLLQVPGFIVKSGKDGQAYVTIAGAAGLLVPVRDAAGRIVALSARRDAAGDGSRYSYLSSRKHGGPGPGTPAHVPAGVTGPCPTCRLTEGALKADVAAALSGLPTVGAAGVANWRPALDVLKDLGCQTLRLALDADARQKPAVARALTAAADGLGAEGFAVELERWPLEAGKGIDDLLAAGGTPEVLAGDAARQAIREIAAAAGLDRLGAGRTGRPQITITTEEHEVNAEAVAALARDPDVYQRGGLLVRVVRDGSPAAKGIRRPFAPRIEPLPPPLLRERLAANAQWVSVRETKEGIIEQPARPPGWCVAAVHARADWPGIRHLEAVVDYPVLRPDGTILSKPGYDPETGLLLDAVAEFPPIPDAPTRAEAVAALGELLEVVGDFPFERNVHQAAYVAALLTPLARFAFAGPAPLFLVDANVRAAGKGLLLDTIARIITGERFTIATYTSDEDELRKRITSLVLAGDRLVLFDNLEGKFGNAVLDAALTGTAWKDRVLGVNRMAEAPLLMSWYATGNNVVIAADTARRVCHIRLESPDERPEERQGFRHPNLLQWVGENRARLLRAALVILRAYCAAGRPDQGLPALGSFEGWSGLVRSAAVWVGLPDPGATRLLLQEQADVAADSMGVVLACWERLDPDRRGLTAAEVIQLLKDPPEDPPDYYADLRDAVEALAGRLDARGLGNRLRSYRRRVFGGRFMDRAGLQQRAVRWAVFPAADFGRRGEQTHETHQTHSVLGPPGECGECGESFSPDARSGAASEGNGEACDGHGDAWEGPER
jgi:hypothetical protein